MIGISAVDGRGMEFKGGGRVVKNVAGYDFCKLLVGSLGTLGIITQVTLKVKPIPEITVLDRNRDIARCTFASLRVDVLFTTNPLFELIQRKHATIHRFLESDVRCATVEGLIVLKLYALPTLYRQGDGQRIGLHENEIFMLCERYRPSMEPLYAIVQPYVDADEMRELRSIVTDIEARIQRVDRLKQPPAAP